MSKLALLGGEKVIKQTIPRVNTIGKEEITAVNEVLQSGELSRFIGAWHEDFYGGRQIKHFEAAWKDFFAVEHAVSVNSATSGLIAALGAIDLNPGDEVIVSPWTMSASATAILVWNAIPVFADIDKQTFNLDPDSIEKNLSPYTKAIVVPSIFGHAADFKAIMKIAKDHNLMVVEDAAQSPGAKYADKYVGTLGDIGVFSLNYHKHIHCGEGGVCVTNNPNLAEKLQLIRNHAEAVVEKKNVSSLVNMLGFNFRLGEMEAAIGIEQLKKLPMIAKEKTQIGLKLIEKLKGLPFLEMPTIKQECTHVFYVFPMLIDVNALGVSRELLCQALTAEGIPGLSGGYVNAHLLPMYQTKTVYGNKHFPWSNAICQREIHYHKGICPIAEHYHDTMMMKFLFSMYEIRDAELNQIVEAFYKVWDNLDDLRSIKEHDL